MNKITISTIAVCALLATGSVQAGSCPVHIKAIDAALAKSPSLSMADLEQVKALRDQGEKLHKSGGHSDSVEALLKARTILDI